MSNPLSTAEFEPASAFDEVDIDLDSPDDYSPDDYPPDALDDPDDIVNTLLRLREVGVPVDFEDRPVVVPKRQPTAPEMPWEEYLGFLTNHPGRTVRLFTFTGENSRIKARSRAREVIKRLAKIHPEEKWSITWDFVKKDESWRVYANYDREYTEQEMAQIHEKQLALQARGRHAAAARQANRMAASE